MRSFVSCGIVFASGESLSTNESVVGERPRCAANLFKLTGPSDFLTFDSRFAIFPLRRDIGGNSRTLTAPNQA
jgi:hypothetical protein